MTPHSSEPTDRATDKESVCFVVVYYNNEHTITECIDSLLQQTIPPSRIVVVDNASQDRTVHLLADYPKVQLVKMERNTGFPAACNAGAKLSTEQLLRKVSAALDRLALAVPQIKKNLLEACVRVVGADGVMQEREAELLRAIAATLDCPIPPFVQVEEA